MARPRLHSMQRGKNKPSENFNQNLWYISDLRSWRVLHIKVFVLYLVFCFLTFIILNFILLIKREIGQANC